MDQTPIGALIQYWLRPTTDRVHLHRIEVEHALYLANANQVQIKDVLSDMLHRQTASLENISYSLDELRDVIVGGFYGVAEGLSRVDDTLHEGFYQLHVDTLGTHTRLDDILSCLLDKEAFKRELAARQATSIAQHSQYEASGVYSDAIALTKRALNESNLGKARAMLDEAIALFNQASVHPEFTLAAHFQLGYLIQMHQRDMDSAYTHYEKALGPTYSSHYVRTTRHLAHLDYLCERPDKGLARLQDLIAHDDSITAFARDLATVKDQPWDDNACIDGLEQALEHHEPLLSLCNRLSDVRRQFQGQRRFSATERFMESYPLIETEMRLLRPDWRAYYDGARYAVTTGRDELALPWIKYCYDVQPTLNARRIFLLEAMTNEDNKMQTFLREAWGTTERQKALEVAEVERQKALEAAEVERQKALGEKARQQQRNIDSVIGAVPYAIAGAVIGGVILGFTGCVSCVNNFRSEHNDFNLFNGLLIGAVAGAVIGAIIGFMTAQTED
jgi:tetratricopeptide (TPR) repeat protein